MPFFTYKASDAKGQPANGTIQAATADDARLALVRAGWTVYDVSSSAGTQPAAPQPTAQQRPQPQAPLRPQQQAPRSVQPKLNPQTPRQIKINAQAAQAPAVPAKTVASHIVHTSQGSDKERFFLFSQLAAAFRAGLNPVTTFAEIASRSKEHYKESLDALGKTAMEGGLLSRVMARYPDLYPEHVVGMTAAGEQGGFLPDAFEQISLQAQSAHKFKKWFFWIWFIFVNSLLLLPGTWWATRSIVKIWDDSNATGGAGGAGVTAGNAFWQTLKWPIGPAFLLLCFLCWASYTFFSSRLAKSFRHRIGLHAPVYGKRARHENLSIFSWVLAKLSRSGLPPATAYRLAAETAPNLEMRNELVGLASRLSGAERMSQIIGNSKLFPEDYVPIIATAEYTGDLSGALQQLSDMSRGEFQTAETYAKMRSGCWGFLAMGVVGGIALMLLCYTWYREIPDKVLNDTGWFQLLVW